MVEKKKEEGSKSGTDEAAAAKWPYVENLFAPEIYADNAPILLQKNANLSITLTSWRFDNAMTPPVGKHVIIGRVVMPITAAKNLADTIYEHLQRNGLLPDKARAN